MANQEVGSSFVSIYPKMTGGWGSIGAQAAAKMSGGFSKGISAMTVAAGNLISNGIGKAVSVVSSSIKAGIGRSDILSGFPKVMEQMGYESDVAQGAINRIAEALTGLPTATQELVPFVQGLVAINGNLDKSTDLGIAFNDMLVASGANTATAANAQEMFSKMLASGAFNAQRWQSITEAMPGTLAQVAQHMLGTGATAADLGKALNNGKVSFDDLTAAMIELDQSGSGSLASFHDQALAAAGGIDTAITNMSTRIGIGFQKIIDTFGNDNIASVINTFSDAIKGSLVNIAGLLEPLASSIDWEGIRSTITGVFQGIDGAISGFVNSPAAKLIGITIGNIAGAFSGLGSQIAGFLSSGMQQAQFLLDGVVFGLSRFVSGIMTTADATPILDAIGTHFSQLYDMAHAFLYGTDWVGAGAMVGNALTIAAQLIGTAVGIISTAFQGLIQGFSAVIAYLPVDFILNALSSIQQGFQFLVDSGVIQFFGQLVGVVLGTVVTGVLTILAGIINGIAYEFTHFGEQVAFVVEFVSGLLDGMYNTINDFVHNVINGIIAFATDIWNNINRLCDDLYNTVQGALDAVFSFVSNIWNSITSTISSVVSSIRNLVSNAFNAVRTAVTNALNAVKSISTSVWNGVKTTVSNAVNAVRSTVSNVFNAVSSTVSSVFNGIKSTAESVWNGIKSAIEGPINAAKDAVDSAINAIKGFFNFEFSWPHIPLPHFTISGSVNPLDWLSQGVPKIGIEWYATGGYFDGATLLGVGESGGELLLPKSGGIMDPFAEAVASKVESDDADKVIAWLSENLPYIISHFTPSVGERDFNRLVRRATT